MLGAGTPSAGVGASSARKPAELTRGPSQRFASGLIDWLFLSSLYNPHFVHALELHVQSNIRRKIKEEQTNLCIFWTLANSRSAALTGFGQPVHIGTCPCVRFGKLVPGSGPVGEVSPRGPGSHFRQSSYTVTCARYQTASFEKGRQVLKRLETSVVAHCVILVPSN